MARVLAYAKDPGGFEGMRAIVLALQKLGHTAFLMTEGKATEICIRDNIAHKAVQSQSEAVGFIRASFSGRRISPDLFLTSMCSGGGVGRDVIPLCRMFGTPTVALQDFWGARLAKEYADSNFQPDYIVVNDDVGAGLVKVAWSKGVFWKSMRTKVIVSGYPALDRYAGYDPLGTDAQIVRKELGIDNGWPVLTFAGQVRRTGQVAMEMAEAILNFTSLYGTLHYIPRAHPRMMSDAPEEAKLWNQSLDTLESRSGGRINIVRDSSKFTMQQIINASRVVAGAFTTSLLEAAVLRKEVISILMPHSGMKAFINETGGIMKEFPLVSLGCAVKASTAIELNQAIDQACKGSLRLRSNQEKYFQVDGRNGERLALKIATLAK